jgi:hypothetical protein
MQKERQNLHSGKRNSFVFPVVRACTSHRVASAHPRCERIDPERRPSGHRGRASTRRRRGRVDWERCPSGRRGCRSSIRHHQSSIRPPWSSSRDSGDGDGGARETSIVRCSTSHKKWCYGLDSTMWSSRGGGSLRWLRRARLATLPLVNAIDSPLLVSSHIHFCY